MSNEDLFKKSLDLKNKNCSDCSDCYACSNCSAPSPVPQEDVEDNRTELTLMSIPANNSPFSPERFRPETVVHLNSSSNSNNTNDLSCLGIEKFSSRLDLPTPVFISNTPSLLSNADIVKPSTKEEKFSE